MWSAIIGIVLVVASIYVLSQNIKYNIYWGFVGLALFIVGLITNADIIGFPGLFLLFGSYYFVWKKKKSSVSGYYSSYPAPSSRKAFSNDIYKAIEEFARLCYQCKQDTGWAYEADFATILVSHTAQCTRLELTCRGDSIACRLPSEFRWLRNDSDLNEIKYVANNVTGYVKENYGSSKPTEADSLFYFYKQGDPHAIGVSLWQKDEGNTVGMHIHLR